MFTPILEEKVVFSKVFLFHFPCNLVEMIRFEELQPVSVGARASGLTFFASWIDGGFLEARWALAQSLLVSWPRTVSLHRGRLTWNLRMHPWGRNIIWTNPSFFSGYVKFRGCTRWSFQIVFNMFLLSPPVGFQWSKIWLICFKWAEITNYPYVASIIYFYIDIDMIYNYMVVAFYIFIFDTKKNTRRGTQTTSGSKTMSYIRFFATIP